MWNGTAAILNPTPATTRITASTSRASRTWPTSIGAITRSAVVPDRPYMIGMSIMYGLSGTTALRVMAPILVGQVRDARLVLAVILVVAGVGFKIAAVPFHMWAPDVYEGAPTPITAFLSVGSKAASFAMLLRIFVEGLPVMSADWKLLFEALSIVTMTVGNVAALTQSNLKRMLAYSSIAHAGYLLIGVVAAGAGYQ